MKLSYTLIVDLLLAALSNASSKTIPILTSTTVSSETVKYCLNEKSCDTIYYTDLSGDWSVENQDWCLCKAKIRTTSITKRILDSEGTLKSRTLSTRSVKTVSTSTYINPSYEELSKYTSLPSKIPPNQPKSDKTATTTTTTTKNPITSTKTISSETVKYCLNEKSCDTIYYTDLSGDWSVENQDWCLCKAKIRTTSITKRILDSEGTLKSKTLSTTTNLPSSTKIPPTSTKTIPGSTFSTSLSSTKIPPTSTKTIPGSTFSTSLSSTKIPPTSTKTIPRSTFSTSLSSTKIPPNSTKTIPGSTFSTSLSSTKIPPTSTKTIPRSTFSTSLSSTKIPPTSTKCLPVTVTVTEKVTITDKVTVTVYSSEPTNQSQGNCAAKWAQCGGIGFSGPTCCEQGTTCHEVNSYYSQCI